MIPVPVIDLLQGRAVHARLGRRDRYAPLDSPLCRAGRVLPLVRRLVLDWGFRHLYLADLDAIQGRGDNRGLVRDIQARHPDLELWLDGGFRGPADIGPLVDTPALRCVAGSETWSSAAAPPPGCLLSVDSDAHGPRDPSGICADPRRRPRDLILMDLSRVGSDCGPNLDLLDHWRQCAPEARLFAAGGVRHRADLQAVAAAGAAGVLLATALHAGRLQPADLIG